jgi:pimeloyl-ACP methyl ester carboxylesterase
MLSFDRSGTGPPLLLLHGIGMGKEVWRPVTPLIARSHDVIAVDLPGFGDSPPGADTVEGLADAVAAFADSLGLDGFHVAGNSMGGGVALELGTRGRVLSACAISPVGFFGNDRERAYARGVLTATRGMAIALAPIADTLTRSALARTAMSAHATAKPWRIPPADAADWTRLFAHSAGFWPLLRTTPRWTPRPPVAPTTVAWGAHDHLLIYSRHAPRARRVLPAARHVTLQGCGHVPTWDDPEQVARVILQASA